MEVCAPELKSLSLCPDAFPPAASLSAFSSFPDDLSDDSSDSGERQLAKARRYSGAFNQSPLKAQPASPRPPAWKPADSADLYNVAGWGAGYVQVNEETGHLEVLPQAGARPWRRAAGGPPAP